MFPKKKEIHKEDRPQPANQPVEQKNTQHVEETETLQKQLEELRKQTEGIQKEKDDIFATLQRVAADYDNYQKRSARQITDSIAYEKDKIIKAILPVLDDFERVLAHKENTEALAKGVGIVYEHLKSVMRAQGVEQITSAGEKFAPEHHEAITQRS